MKTSVVCALALLAAAGPVRAQDDASPRERARDQLAVRAAAAQLMQYVRAAGQDEDQATPALVAALSARMLDDAAAHRSLTQSVALSGRIVEEAVRRRMEEAWSNAFRQVQGQTGRPIPEQVLRELLGKEWDRVADEAVARHRQARFDAIFRDARAQAVARQRGAVDAAAKPPDLAWFDARLAPLFDDGNRLATDAADRLAADLEPGVLPAGVIALDEVQAHLDQRAREWAAEAVRHYDGQAEVIRKPDAPEALRTAPAIEAHLAARLDELARNAEGVARAAGRPPVAAGVFPSIRSRVRPCAETLEQERLAAFAQRWGYDGIKPAEILSRLENAAERHREPARSLKDFVDAEAERNRPVLARAYDPSEADRMAVLLAGGGRAAAAYRARIEEVLRPAIGEARAALAARQLASRLPPSLERTAPPEHAAVAWRDERSRAIDSLREAYGRLGAEGVKVDPAPVLYEAETDLVVRVRARVAAAVDAVERQEQVVRDMEKERMDALRRDVEAGVPLARLQAAWRAEWKTRWAACAPANGWYEGMLDRTERELEKSVRQLFDSLRQRAAASTAAEQTRENPREPQDPAVQAPREGTAPPEADRSAQRKQAAGMSDELLLSSADVVLRLGDRSQREGQGGLTEGEDRRASFDYDPAAAQEAAEAIFRNIREPFRAILDARAGSWRKADGGFNPFRHKASPEIKVYVVVEGNEVRHRTSLLLRRKVEDLVEAWSAEKRPGQDPVKLRWTVGLGESPPP